MRRNVFGDMAVAVPEGVHGSVAVERFEAVGGLENFRLSLDGRGCQPGWYTRLMRDGEIWMSDTTAERRDHFEPAHQIRRPGVRRVLIGGLGLGMILRVALLTDGVEHVDVVEIDPDVLALVGPHYLALAAERGVSLTFHEADLFKIRWDPGTEWDVAWFDIWPDVDTTNLEGMARLRRSYGRRTGWCDCWCRLELVRRREYERNAVWAS